MYASRGVVRLSWLVVFLAAAAAGAGLAGRGARGPLSFTTVRGETVELYGRGVYRHDSVFTGAANVGTDVVTLALGIPLLLFSVFLYRRGSARGGLLLVGMLGYFLYVYATLAVGVAYNALFLLYVALFAASFWAFVLAYGSLARAGLRFGDRLPRRGIAAFLFVSGVLTLAVWLEAPLRSLATGEPPRLLDGYTTMVTYALDLAVIVPAVFAAGALLLRRDPRGYLVAVPLLVLIVMLVPVIAAQTVSQLSAGVAFTPAEIAGPIGGFVTLGVGAVWIVGRVLRDVSEPGPAPAGRGSPEPGRREAPGLVSSRAR